MTPERLAEIRARAEVGTEAFDFTCPSCGSAPGVRCYGNGPMPVAMTHQSRHAVVDAVKQSAVIDRLELVAEVERLRARVGSCDGGCNYNSGPEETCSLHGRPVAEVWQIVNDVAAERDARINALAQQVEKVRALHRSDGHEPDKCSQPNCFTACDECGDVYPCPTLQALDD